MARIVSPKFFTARGIVGGKGEAGDVERRRAESFLEVQRI